MRGPENGSNKRNSFAVVATSCLSRSVRGVRRADRCKGLETVAHPRLGDEVTGPRWIGLELPPDLREIDAEVVRLLLVLRAPYFLQQLALGDELAGVADERLNDLPLGRGQADFAFGGRDAFGREVDGEVLRSC
jgi:hypothetical protein